MNTNELYKSYCPCSICNEHRNLCEHQRDEMHPLEVIQLMANGNPGAVTVLCELIQKEHSGGLMAIVWLEEMGLRGDKIWICYKDICGQDIDKLINKCLHGHGDIKKRIDDLYSSKIVRNELNRND